MQKLSFSEAKILTAMLGFHSKREYQKATLPKGLYKNPAQAYPEEFEGWDEYLGKEALSVKKDKILEIVRNSGIDSFACWRECIDARILCGKRYPKEINKVNFSDEVKKIFRLNKYDLPESVFIKILKREGIFDLTSYKEYIRKYRTNLPHSPSQYYKKPWAELISRVNSKSVNN